jgi:hypothetical protein
MAITREELKAKIDRGEPFVLAEILAEGQYNRIGITTVALERVDGASLWVRGLDAIDGTPVLDVKPHVPAFDAPAGARLPEWMLRLMKGYF